MGIFLTGEDESDTNPPNNRAGSAVKREEALKIQVNQYFTAIALARSLLLQANATGVTERSRRALIRKANHALAMPHKPDAIFTVVKLRDDEHKPVAALCAIEGYCCFDRAYQIGRIDERESRPYAKKAKARR